MNSKSEELKPCPFCGGEPEMHYTRPTEGIREGWLIWCHKCHAGGNWHTKEEDAIRTWNTRAGEEIATTLGGSGNHVSERLRGVASDMRSIGASSMTPHELFAYWAREVDKAADLADFLVSMNPDGLPVGLTISEDGNLLDWRGVNYVRQSALGGGKLTAEQVRETVEKHWHDLSADYDMPEATALPEYSYDWQAIADELNATLGGGECDMDELKRWDGSDPHYRCKACGHENNEDYMPRFCPWCGKAVKR